jgi:hypothetical protein
MRASYFAATFRVITLKKELGKAHMMTGREQATELAPKHVQGARHWPSQWGAEKR